MEIYKYKRVNSLEKHKNHIQNFRIYAAELTELKGEENSTNQT